MTQCSDAGETGTRGPSVLSQALYRWATDDDNDDDTNHYSTNIFVLKCCLLIASAAFMHMHSWLL